MAKKNANNELFHNEMNVIKFRKTRDVKSPDRANNTDAGIDFFVPKFNKDFIEKLINDNPQIFGDEDSQGIEVSGTLTINNHTFSDGTSFQVDNDTNNVKYTQDSGDKYEEYFKFDTEKGKNYFLLHSHQRILIPSGVQCRMQSPGRALIAANKGGVASKHGLVFGAQVVDSEYMNEIHISVINTSTSPVRIYEDMKIIQYLEMPVYTSTVEIQDTTEEDFYKGFASNRGKGGFGSTGE